MPGESPQTLIKELLTLRARKRADEARIKEIELMLPDVFEQNGISKISLDEGPTAYTSSRTKAWIVKEHQDRAYEDLRALGAGSLIKSTETVNHSSLSAWVKSRLQNGEPIPDSIKHSSDMTVNVRLNGWEPDHV